MMEIVDVIKKNKTIWLPGILTTFVIWLPVAFGVSTLLLAGIRRGTDWISATRLEKKCGQILTGKRSFWIGWGCIFLLWLPALLASWPGVYVIDNVFQFQWFQEGNISAHHPILHTYLLGHL